MSNKIIPINRHAPPRAVLRESFSETNDQIVYLITRMQATAIENDDHFFGLCDDLRSQVGELGDILRYYAQLEQSANQDGCQESIRILILMISHMELMFLYARKNSASQRHYREEIRATAEAFLHRHAQVARDAGRCTTERGLPYSSSRSRMVATAGKRWLPRFGSSVCVRNGSS